MIDNYLQILKDEINYEVYKKYSKDIELNFFLKTHQKKFSPFSPNINQNFELNINLQHQLLKRDYHSRLFKNKSHKKIINNYEYFPNIISLGRSGSTKVMRDFARLGFIVDESLRGFWQFLYHHKDITYFEPIEQIKFNLRFQIEKFNPYFLYDLFFLNDFDNKEKIFKKFLFQIDQSESLIIVREPLQVIVSELIADLLNIWNLNENQLGDYLNRYNSSIKLFEKVDSTKLINLIKKHTNGLEFLLKICLSLNNIHIIDYKDISSQKYYTTLSSLSNKYNTKELPVDDTLVLRNYDTNGYYEKFTNLIENNFDLSKQNELYSKIKFLY